MLIREGEQTVLFHSESYHGKDSILDVKVYLARFRLDE